jgi:hypothetical protein
MFTRTIRFMQLPAWVVLFLVPAGCTNDSAVRSTVELQHHFRLVKGTLDHVASIAAEGDNIVVSFDSHKLIFEKHRVMLDDTEQLRLPPGSSRVEFEYIGGKLSVSARGKPIMKEGVLVNPKETETPAP